jgi:hypothetical protein
MQVLILHVHLIPLNPWDKTFNSNALPVDHLLCDLLNLILYCKIDFVGLLSVADRTELLSMFLHSA